MLVHQRVCTNAMCFPAMCKVHRLGDDAEAWAPSTRFAPLKRFNIEESATRSWWRLDIWMCLKMLCTPLNPMVLLIVIPMKNGYFIGNINPTFSDKPIFMFDIVTSTVGKHLSWPCLAAQKNAVRETAWVARSEEDLMGGKKRLSNPWMDNDGHPFPSFPLKNPGWWMGIPSKFPGNSLIPRKILRWTGWIHFQLRDHRHLPCNVQRTAGVEFASAKSRFAKICKMMS